MSFYKLPCAAGKATKIPLAFELNNIYITTSISHRSNKINSHCLTEIRVDVVNDLINRKLIIIETFPKKAKRRILNKPTENVHAHKKRR